MPRRAPPPQTGRLLFFLYLLMMTVAEPPCPPGSPCASPCAPHSTTQCLHYLQESHKHEVCNRDMPPGRRRDLFAALRLRHCCEHRVDRALPEAAFHGGKQCHIHLQELLQADEDAALASCTHTDLLKRYDCTQNYSIAHDCPDCKVAYRRWICSELIPHYVRHPSGTGSKLGDKGGAGASLPAREFLVRPCPSVCQKVEEQCPYLVPDQTLTPAEMAHPTPQYAGEPTFLCLDLNIPRLEQLGSKSGQEDCCYTHCGTPGRGGTISTTTDKGGGTHQHTEVMTSVHQPYEHPSSLEICEHCPGRPDTLTDTPTDGADTEASASSASSSSAIVVVSRTNNTFVFYTMLLLSLFLTQRHPRKLLIDLFKCLIVRANNNCCSSDKERTVPPPPSAVQC